MKVREAGLLVVIGVLSVFFWSFNPKFLTYDNIAIILRSCSFVGIMSVGIGVLLISGMIDISVGAIAGLSNIVVAYLTVEYHVPFMLSLPVGLIVGGLAGYVNAKLTLKLNLPAFLATIGTMYAFRGLALFISGGYTIYPLPEEVRKFGVASPLGISWHFLIFITLLFISHIILEGSVLGLQVKAVGSDREVAHKTEVDVPFINTVTFVVCGILSGLSGILLMTRIITGQATIGTGWELSAITAAAIGGVSLFGYEGSMLGVFLGVVLIQLIENGLVTIGLSPYLHTVTIGIFLIVTAIYDINRRRKLEL